MFRRLRALGLVQADRAQGEMAARSVVEARKHFDGGS